MGGLGALSCTRVTLVETGSVGEPGLLLERFAMCTQERQRKGSFGLITYWFRVFSSTWLGDLHKPHSKEFSIGKAVTVFRFHKSMTRDARRGQRRLSHGSLHRHQVLLEPGHSFTSPKFWTPRDWRSPLNQAPSASNKHIVMTISMKCASLEFWQCSFGMEIWKTEIFKTDLFCAHKSSGKCRTCHFIHRVTLNSLGKTLLICPCGSGI